MSGERRQSSWWRRKWRRLLALLLAAPFLCIAAGDLWFSLPWGRGWIGGKLSARVHLPVTVGACYWTPWSGAVLSELQVAPPPEAEQAGSSPPLLRVPRIQVDVNWTSCLRGRPMFDRVVIGSPELTLTPETLKSLVASHGPETPSPEAAKSDLPPLAAAPPPPPVSGAPSVPVRPPVPAKPEAAPPAIPAPERPATIAVEDTRPGAIVEIRHGHFLLLGGHGNAPLAEAKEFDLTAPLQGKEAMGEVSLAELTLGGRSLAQGVKLPLQWKSPELRVLDQPVQVAGLKVQVTFHFGRLPGLPFLLEGRCPAQPLPPWQAPLERKVSAARVQGVVQFGGALPAPGTWQALALGMAEDLRLDSPGKVVTFSRGEGNVFFRNGTAICPDLRLIGDDYSLLGNATAGHGEAAATLRWVVPQEAANIRVQKLKRQNPQWNAVFSPMETPERTYLDFHWISHGPVPGIELGEGGSILTPAEFAAWVEG